MKGLRMDGWKEGTRKFFGCCAKIKSGWTNNYIQFQNSINHQLYFIKRVKSFVWPYERKVGGRKGERSVSGSKK